MKKILKISFLIFVGLVVSFVIYLNINYSTPILMYHSFDSARVGDYAAVSPEVFKKQMESIKAWGYKPVPLSAYCRMLKDRKSIPRKSIVLTADDGYNDNLAAVKILKEFKYPMTIFIIVDNIGKEGYLSSSDIETFLKNNHVEIGSHTLSHDYLPDLSNKAVDREIRDSRVELEKLFKRKVYTLSYPIGGFNREALGSVKESGYLCACSTNRGFSKRINRWQLRRIKITDRDLGFRLWAKLSGFYNALRRPKNPY